MSHYKDPYEPPLQAKFKMNIPAWHPSYKEYNGRPDWWLENGYTDELLRKGMSQAVRIPLKEQNKLWFDPKVPDGTSVTGPLGLDSVHHRDLTKKFDQPITFEEHQKMVTESSGQYKNIINKWEISPEHPGFRLSPTLEKGSYDYKDMGTLFNMHKFLQFHRGPRFWDKPMNEGCIEKGLALLKYTAILTFYAAYGDQMKRDRNLPLQATALVKRWGTQWLPVPGVLAMSFGVAACTSAKIRHKDDTWNWTIASIVAGALHATIRNYSFPVGFLTTVPLIIAAAHFQSLRVRFHGVQGFSISQMYSGLIHPYTGPLNWKYFPWNTFEQTRVAIVPEAWKSFKDPPMFF